MLNKRDFVLFFFDIFFPLQGRYDYYECGVEIRNAGPEDTGEWSCDLEEYIRGGERGQGAKVRPKRLNHRKQKLSDIG